MIRGFGRLSAVRRWKAPTTGRIGSTARTTIPSPPTRRLRRHINWVGLACHFRPGVGGGHSVVAHGRIICYEATDELLIVRSAYNGSIFWRRNLPKSFSAIRSSVIAKGDIVYLAEESSVVCLDAATGKETGKIDFSQAGSFVKWIGLSGETLVMLGGPEDVQPPPYSEEKGFRNIRQEKKLGFGTGISTYDVVRKKSLWTWKEPTPIDSRMIGICDGKVFFW